MRAKIIQLWNENNELKRSMVTDQSENMIWGGIKNELKRKKKPAGFERTQSGLKNKIEDWGGTGFFSQLLVIS